MEKYPCPCCGYLTYPVPREEAIAYILSLIPILMLVSGSAGLDDLSGPVGIVSTIKDVGEEAQEEACLLYTSGRWARRSPSIPRR